MVLYLVDFDAVVLTVHAHVAEDILELLNIVTVELLPCVNNDRLEIVINVVSVRERRLFHRQNFF